MVNVAQTYLILRLSQELSNFSKVKYISAIWNKAKLRGNAAYTHTYIPHSVTDLSCLRTQSYLMDICH